MYSKLEYPYKKFTLEQAKEAQRGLEVLLYTFFNLGARWGWVVHATPRPLYPRERDPVPNGRRLGRRQGRSGRVRKISAQPGFDPRTA